MKIFATLAAVIAVAGIASLVALKAKKNSETEQSEKQSDYFNIDEICQILHISRETATRLCKEEGFPCIKIGKLYRISKEGFYKWVHNDTLDPHIGESARQARAEAIAMAIRVRTQLEKTLKKMGLQSPQGYTTDEQTRNAERTLLMSEQNDF